MASVPAEPPEEFSEELQGDDLADSVATIDVWMPARRTKGAREWRGSAWRGRAEFDGFERPVTAESAVPTEAARVDVLFFGVGGERRRTELHFAGFEWACELPFHPDDVASAHVVGATWNGRLWRLKDSQALLPLDLDSPAVLRFELAPVTALRVVDLDSPAVLRFELAPVTALRVVDAETGAPIKKFRASLRSTRARPTVELFPDDPAASRLPTGPWRGFSTRKLELHPDARWGTRPGEPVVAHVVADGHAMVSLDVSLGTGVEHEVRLPRGGSAKLLWEAGEGSRAERAARHIGAFVLSVEPIHVPGEATPRERIELLCSWDFGFENPFADDEVWPADARLERVVEHLAPGKYRVRLRHESAELQGITRLAEAECTVEAGRCVEVTLQDVAVPEELDRNLELQFAMPAGVGAPEREFAFLRRLNDGEWGRERPLDLVAGAWRTKPVYVRPGRFLVILRGSCSFQQEFDLSPDAPSPLVLTPPALHPLRIELACTGDGSALARQPVCWRDSEDSVRQEARRLLAQPTTSELFTDRLPVQVFLPPNSAFELADGPFVELTQSGEHRLNCIERPRVRLRFQSDGEDVGVPRGLKVHFGLPIFAHEPRQEPYGVGTNRADELRVWFPEPGLYLLEFEELADFEPLPSLQLDIGPRHDQLVELPLVRRR